MWPDYSKLLKPNAPTSAKAKRIAKRVSKQWRNQFRRVNNAQRKQKETSAA